MKLLYQTIFGSVLYKKEKKSAFKIPISLQCHKLSHPLIITIELAILSFYSLGFVFLYTYSYIVCLDPEVFFLIIYFWSFMLLHFIVADIIVHCLFFIFQFICFHFCILIFLFEYPSICKRYFTRYRDYLNVSYSLFSFSLLYQQNLCKL